MADLTRFYEPWRRDFPVALAELQAGRKESHWMWYIFPQLRGLGYSETAYYYGIAGAAEARAFLADPVLGSGLRELAGVLLELKANDPAEVFPYPDDLKLHSSMTLFAAVGGGAVFEAVLRKYFDGTPDRQTLDLLKKENNDDYA